MERAVEILEERNYIIYIKPATGSFYCILWYIEEDSWRLSSFVDMRPEKLAEASSVGRYFKESQWLASGLVGWQA